MKDRIICLRKKEGLTQEEFGRKIGLTDPMISMFESGKKVPQDSTIKLICYTFGVREDWLRHGTGNMEEPTNTESSEERLLLSLFRKLSPAMKTIVLEKIEELQKAWEITDTENPSTAAEKKEQKTG